MLENVRSIERQYTDIHKYTDVRFMAAGIVAVWIAARIRRCPKIHNVLAGRYIEYTIREVSSTMLKDGDDERCSVAYEYHGTR